MKSISKFKQPEDIHNYYKKIISCMPNNVYWLDRNCVTLGCNDNTLKLVGLKSIDEFIGITYEEMGRLAGWTEGQAESFKRDDMAVMESGKPKLNVEELPLYDADGNPVYYLSSRIPLFDNDKNVIGVVGISVDITELKKKDELILKEQKEKAKQAMLAKSEFIRNMEHDIRTPFCGILGLADHLWKQEDNLEKKEILGYIRNSAEELLEYCNNVLDFSKIENGVQPVLEKNFNIYKLAKKIIALEAPAAKNKDLDLELEYNSKLPDNVIGDEYRIHKILINLISNSIKFTPKGKITIKFDLAKKTEKNIILQLTVEDTGIGMPADKLDYIYEKFTRLIPSNKGCYKGMGVGLKIVKQFVEDVDGEIQVSSEISKGTVFVVLLPLKLSLLNKDIF